MEEWAKSGLLEFRKVRFAGKGREPNGERQKYGFTGTLSRLNGSGFWKVKRDRPGTVGISLVCFLAV